MDEILSAISTVGFPIFCCIAMTLIGFRAVQVIVSVAEKALKYHAEESDKWIKALDNNTDAINKLLFYMERGE